LERITLRRISFFIAAAIAAVIGTVGLGTGVASAHHPVIVGHTVCQTDGTWTVQWTVSNSETAAGRVMTFDSAEVNGASITLSPGSVAPGGSAAGTSTHTAATNSATLVVAARWAYANVTDTKTATVLKPEQCVVTTTTTEATTTTTEASTTTTTAAEDTATTAEVTTTVAEVATTLTENRPLVTPAPTPEPEGHVEAVHVTNGAVAQTLPSTGAASVPVAILGGGLLLVGGLIVIAARRYGTTV
jgi:LPXTG-motif cell wall-anchored protein